jgi:hypothetical protein
MTETPVEKMLERITDKALSQAWSMKNGARNLRILSTLIRWKGLSGSHSLDIITSLRLLAANAGMTYSTSILDALCDLQAQGWITFDLGTGAYDPEKRIATKIKLIPVSQTGQFPVKSLPDPKVSLYKIGNQGSPAYALIALMSHEPSAKTYSLRAIHRLTGIPLTTLQRLMPKMRMHFIQVDGLWMATDLESANGHDDWLYDTHDARSNVKAVIEQTAKDKAAIAERTPGQFQRGIPNRKAKVPPFLITRALDGTETIHDTSVPYSPDFDSLATRMPSLVAT